jgi:hypothetical protein
MLKGASVIKITIEFHNNFPENSPVVRTTWESKSFLIPHRTGGLQPFPFPVGERIFSLLTMTKIPVISPTMGFSCDEPLQGGPAMLKQDRTPEGKACFKGNSAKNQQAGAQEGI